jgi:hypothetical protein
VMHPVSIAERVGNSKWKARGGAGRTWGKPSTRNLETPSRKVRR